MFVKRGTWCGGTASVDCSATIIGRRLDAMQYFNHTTTELHHQVTDTLLPQAGSVSKVEMEAPISLIYKVLFPSIFTFETPPKYQGVARGRSLTQKDQNEMV